jgi:phosphoribosylaminoimidazole (AIR) synthetase
MCVVLSPTDVGRAKALLSARGVPAHEIGRVEAAPQSPEPEVVFAA